MAENEWMFRGRISKTERTDEWEYKTDLLVKELARGSKSVVRPLCPCARCKKRHRESNDEMTKHLWQYGYWTGYVTSFDFSQYDAISQALADKARYSKTRAGFEADLKTYGNMLPEGHCLPKSLHEAKKLLKGLNMDYEKID